MSFGPNGTIHASGGISTLNGKALLFYIGLKGFTPFANYSDANSPARNFVFASFSSVLDITVVGGGGSGNCEPSYCGGSGGGGARAIVQPKGNVHIRIGGGMNTQWTSSQYGRSPGTNKSHPGTTFVTDSSHSFHIIGYSGGFSHQKGGNGQVINPTGFVHTSTGANSDDELGGVSVYGSQKDSVKLYDSSFEPDFGGRGQGLNTFCNLPATKGSGLGGGGGGQNVHSYGGNSIGYPGGRYGYKGGIANINIDGSIHENNIYNYGDGPSPGESNGKRGGSGNANGGGGGSFGGGGGADGSIQDTFGAGGTGAGGAVLIRVLSYQNQTRRRISLNIKFKLKWNTYRKNFEQVLLI